MDWYSLVKTIHILAVISWMAGLLYLPRIFVYHAESSSGPHKEPILSFITMERKLYSYIMTPAMVVSWVCGLVLVWHVVSDAWALWVWFKGVSIIAMSAFHMWLGAQRRKMAVGQVTLSGRGYRMMNEVPTLLMVVIVASVVFKF